MKVKLWFFLSLCVLFPIVIAAQEAMISRDKLIRDGFHIAPIAPTTKGFTFGIGYSRPVASKMMAHVTLAYLPVSVLNGEAINSSGFALTPALIYFPGRIDNYKGFTFGAELPVSFYNMRKNEWINNTAINEVSSFEYQRYRKTEANALQFGLAGRFGFRTHRRNFRFFWQPNVCVGFLYQRLYGFKEDELLPNVFDGRRRGAFANQDNGFAPYARLEIAFGLYRFKKETVQAVEL